MDKYKNPPVTKGGPPFGLHFFVIEFMIKQELRETAIYCIIIEAIAIQYMRKINKIKQLTV
jgi:hypothetical protein